MLWPSRSTGERETESLPSVIAPHLISGANTQSGRLDLSYELRVCQATHRRAVQLCGSKPNNARKDRYQDLKNA